MPARATMSVERSRKISDELISNPKFKDFVWFCEEFFKVLNRPETSGGGRVSEQVLLRLNLVQKDLAQKIQAAEDRGSPGRFIILKARRMGVSTVVQAYFMWRCLTGKHVNAFIAALDDTTTSNIFAMAKRILENLPSSDDKPAKNKEEALKKIKESPYDIRPERRLDNVNQLWLAHKNDADAGLDSRYEVVTAKAVNSTRGFEIHLFHGSEVAFWESPSEFMLGLNQCLSDDPKTLVVLESTANGTGGYFYDEFWAAWKKEDKFGNPIETEWESIFYPWHAMPSYSRPLRPGVTEADFVSACDDILVGMLAEYDLTVEQANWAKYAWANKCARDWDLFRQEYPGKPEEAFAFASSRVFYEPDIVHIETAHVKRPEFVGAIVDVVKPVDGRLNEATQMEPELQGDQRGGLWVWEYPQPGAEYVVSVDPSAGMTAGDNTAIQVIQVDNLSQAAEFVGTMGPMETAEMAVLLSLFYENALLSWEVNGVGHAVSAGVLQTSYWRLFERENVERDGSESRIGWSTSRSSKPVMVTLGVSLVTRKAAVIRSERLLYELRSYREFTKRGMRAGGIVAGEEKFGRVRYGAPPGDHDDALMSWLQAIAVLEMEGLCGVGEVNAQASRRVKDPRTEIIKRWEQSQEELERDALVPRYIGNDWI